MAKTKNTTSSSRKTSANPMKAVATKKKVVKRKPAAKTRKKSKAKSWNLSSVTIRNIIAFFMSVVILGGFYLFFIRPYSYRWMPCKGMESYEVCMPVGFSIHGLDISRHQGDIDWFKLVDNQSDEAPLHFVFMKATEGGDFKDVTFDQNLKNTRENGFMAGAYHFYAPRTSAKKQAEFFIETVDLESGDLPPVLDVEVFGKSSKADFKDSVKLWIDIVEKHYKVKPIIYTSYKFKKKYLSDPIFDQYPFWIAHYYVDAVRYKGKWDFWQHTDVGVVEGVEKPVDLNVFNGTLDELKALRLP